MSTVLEAVFHQGETVVKTYRARLLFGFWWSRQGMFSSAEALVTRWEKLEGWQDPEDMGVAVEVSSPAGTVHLGLDGDGYVQDMTSAEWIGHLLGEGKQNDGHR